MDEYTRPATPLADLKVLIGSLNRQGAEYPLIGGYALFAHGYHRATTDIDVLVPATRQAGERIKAIISRELRTLQTTREKDLADRIVLGRALAALRRRS